MKASIILEKLGSYAFLKQTEDLTNNDSNIKAARLSKLSSEISAISIFGLLKSNIPGPPYWDNDFH